MTNNNGERKILEKLVLWIAILTAIIAPWIYHDRAITALNVKIDIMQKDISEVKTLMNNHITGSVMTIPDKKTVDKF